MSAGSDGSVRFVVRVRRRGEGQFDWVIYRKAKVLEIVEQSARPFATRTEAIMDSARAAALLNLGPLSIQENGADPDA